MTAWSRFRLLCAMFTFAGAVSCSGSKAATKDEVEAAVAQIVSTNTLALADPTVNVWGERCPSRDSRLSYCDELSASIQWVPDAAQSLDLCQAAVAVSADLESRLPGIQVVFHDDCGMSFCYAQLPGVVSMYEPSPTLQVMLGSDTSRCP